MDACESKVEIVTPYWASNSAGKIRAIVNTQHFEQAIHQEVCVLVFHHILHIVDRIKFTTLFIIKYFYILQ